MKTYSLITEIVVCEAQTDSEQTLNTLNTSRRLRDKYTKQDLSSFTT